METEFEEKPWGKEEILTIRKKYMVKRLHMNKECRCSLQYHEYKMETIIVISGTLMITKNHQNAKHTWEDIILDVGDHLTIMPGEIHRMQGVTDTIYLEASTPETDDVVRVEDDYGRV